MAGTAEGALRDWAAHATEEELSVGPTLADLGGVSALLSEAESLATGPHLPYLLQALAHDISEISADQADPLLGAVVRGLKEPHAAWVLAEAIDVLCTSEILLKSVGGSAARELTAHAESALATNRDAAFAQPAIAGLLRLAVAGETNPRRLLLLLTDITGSEPTEALERLPILIGIAYDHFSDRGLLDVLAILEELSSLSMSARADASFELALSDLRAALESGDRAVVEQQLRKALERFKEIDITNETRFDARSFRAAIEAILAFGALEMGSQTDDVSEQLARAANCLHAAAMQSAAWSGRMHELTWLSARGLERGAWAQLVASLETARNHLDQPSWYNPNGALSNLLDVYVASRSVRTPSGAGGIDLLISPPVEASFVRHEGLWHHLEQALVADPEFIDHPDAQKLYEVVRKRRELNRSGGAEDVVPGKALDGRPALRALFYSDRNSLREDLEPEFLDSIERMLEVASRGFVSTGNSRFDGHLEKILNELSASISWKPKDSSFFTVLVEQFLRFLYDRFDAQADLYGDRTAYLGPPKVKEDGTVEKWKEKPVQDDFHQHLSGVLTPGTVQREIIDVASGRTDITYTPSPGSRFVIEVKRRLGLYSHEGIEQDYLAQTANYTATGPPFSMLLVGDHSDHSAGYSDVEDRVWIAQRSRSGTEVPRFIVIGALPIGRPTPSALRTA